MRKCCIKFELWSYKMEKRRKIESKLNKMNKNE